MKSSVHLSLESDILEKLTKLSDKANKSRNQIVNELILSWIEDYEDYLTVKESLEEIDSGKDTVISHEELKRELARLK